MDSKPTREWVYPELLHEWALTQVPIVNDYLHKKAKEQTLTTTDNPLINSTLPGIWLFAIHLGLWGWPDREEELHALINYMLLDWNIPFGNIIQEWGVEGTCVLGGYETRYKDASIDVSNIGKLELPIGIQERLLYVVSDTKVIIE